MDNLARVQPEPPQPQPQAPQAPPTTLVVDDLEVNKVYWIYLKYPQYLNDDSPTKGQPKPTLPRQEDGWHAINAPAVPGNVRTALRHLGLLVHYDSTTKIGMLLIGTGAMPDQPQRFVPLKGTQRLPKQPPSPLIPDPEDAFRRHQGYLNFSHLICARVVQQGEHGVGNFFPGLVHVKEILAGAQILQTSLPPQSMSYLKDLHEAYWNGIRYNESGEIIPLRRWGGSRRTGGVGNGQGGAQGEHGASHQRKKNKSARAQGVSDPLDPITGLTHSMLMEIAERQALAADEQARLAAGEVDENSKCSIVALFPLVGEVIFHCDPFPSEVVRDPFPSEGVSPHGIIV